MNEHPTLRSLLAVPKVDEEGRRDTPLVPAGPRPSTPTRATLMVLNGSNAGRIVAIDAGGVVIGRAASADLVVLDPAVSRRHARVASGPEDTFLVEDLGSINGTFVDGSRITLCRIEPGSCVQLGPELLLRFSLSHAPDEALQRRLYESSVRDVLTRAFNRAYFADRLMVELAIAQRTSGDVALLLIDLDHLKDVNDRHGHLSGDRALAIVSKHIAAAIRVEDVLARYGGDEFVVLAGRTDLGNAIALAERVRGVVAALSFAAGGHPVDMTVSVGVASLRELPRDHDGDPLLRNDPTSLDTRVALIALADERLYESKRGGRNRVSPAA